jgi:tRNA modification GTPase
VDASEPLQESDWEIAELIGNKPTILVINKMDLPAVADTGKFLPETKRVRVSALTEQGLRELEETIVETIFSGHVVASDAPLVSNPRHKQALEGAAEHVRAAEAANRRNVPTDFMAIDLTAAVNMLGEITGETATEDLLEIIFSEFCVGK